MIAVYAFLAMFTLQILLSVLGSAWRIRSWRAQATSLPAERLAQLFPGVDLGQRRERFFARYRALHTGIAVLGLLLLGWLFSYMWRPDWDMPRVTMLVCAYFLVQGLLPFGLVVWHGVRSNRKYGIERSLLLEGKRTATLQRRGLFDFISPITVLVAVLGYLLFAWFVIQHPFPGRRVSLVALTLAYALNAFAVYGVLYGKKANPFETHAGHLRRIGLAVRTMVYMCIAYVALSSLTFMLVGDDLKRWMPFALSTFFVIVALLALISSGSVPPRSPEADGLGSGGESGTGDLSA